MNIKEQLITNLGELKNYLNLSDEEYAQALETAERHPFQTTRYYMNLIDPDDPDDPIRKMQFPTILEESTDGLDDTSGEEQNTVEQGLQHKYERTALLLSTGFCYMYCRHCFRKRLVGQDSEEILRNFDAAFDYIQDHEEINNVLISGGDSFTLSNKVINYMLDKLYSLEHIEFVRFSTRVPVVLPQRISEDPELLDILEKHAKVKQVYVVTQFNHPTELTEEAIKAIQAMKDRGIIILNQCVLMRGVNDDPLVLGELLRKMVTVGINPYYVFQCRPVRGVKNIFQIPLLEAIDIVEAAKGEVSGLGKRIRFAMSHVSGKIEIMGRIGNNILFKQHQSPDKEAMSEMFFVEADDQFAWLPDQFEKKYLSELLMNG